MASSKLLQRLWMRSSLRYCSSSTKFSDLYQDLMIKVVSEKSQIPESQIEPRINAMMSSRVDKLESSQMQNFIKILSRDPANHYIWVKVKTKKFVYVLIIRRARCFHRARFNAIINNT